MIERIIVNVFYIYYLLILGRIILSFFPDLNRYRFAHFIYFYTEPYLKIFRKLIPPIGGMIDISVILALFSLRILKIFILKAFL